MRDLLEWLLFGLALMAVCVVLLFCINLIPWFLEWSDYFIDCYLPNPDGKEYYRCE